MEWFSSSDSMMAKVSLSDIFKCKRPLEHKFQKETTSSVSAGPEKKNTTFQLQKFCVF